ncbi:MAG TPA: tryptophan--tRNA ligase, partial [Epsilonproteobacteria bacterium]|nr:tryptophan--tRNA ligase [Campylobacterota bacterium]
MMKQGKYKVDIFTGIRPTAELTVGNVLGAVYPLLELQSGGMRPMVFVADMHGLTSHEPKEIKEHVKDIVIDYITLGLDPEKVDIYIQSDIDVEVSLLTTYLMRHITVSELIKVPTLKDKIKEGNRLETANALLAAYPVMMAADILLQRSQYVPVGEDQRAHLEITRLIAKRFNSKYGPVFPLPKTQEVKLLKILSLDGKGKMSKSRPNGAIVLSDSPKEAEKKIKRAETAFAGKMNDVLESHFLIATGLTKNEAKLKEVERIRKAHMSGEKVMGDFKKVLSEIVGEF